MLRSAHLTIVQRTLNGVPSLNDQSRRCAFDGQALRRIWEPDHNIAPTRELECFEPSFRGNSFDSFRAVRESSGHFAFDGDSPASFLPGATCPSELLYQRRMLRLCFADVLRSNDAFSLVFERLRFSRFLKPSHHLLAPWVPKECLRSFWGLKRHFSFALILFSLKLCSRLLVLFAFGLPFFLQRISVSL
ncbi:hypothetical protein PIB30_049880 [Stylosanthes scabra]|uniref:Uncharacterized protein n=1 Tax=Stylosanthes scabra TaxID=79078 RepID=A0ABU6WKT8_9FABA|nr:hypothetical protein [Stylosanthes scabra]